MQGQTMQMMYDIVGQELKSMNIENAHPEDYLNFYCLGNREECPKDIMEPTDQPSEKSPVVWYPPTFAERMSSLILLSVESYPKSDIIWHKYFLVANLKLLHYN